MANALEKADLPLSQKLGHALNRVQVAMRADSWESFGQGGLKPTQGQILILLSERAAAPRLSEIASELAVSSPTVSDSVATLVEKGYVRKSKAKDDARAVAIQLTPAGKKLIKQLDSVGGAMQTILSCLPESEQIQLYRTMLRMVRELQVSGRIPVGRMCVTCRYFRPNAHKDSNRPHHCALVDLAFGDRTLRSDCPDHEAADEHLAAQNWESFAACHSSE
ncbi:MAG TPA: MarR family winged helix-turn-helix transcriptional regulator [Phycisphaerae bacterium]|nr:MarR family winged helix-turn-helix transcriptional regulator [Phycisphaerae bacterium]